MNKDPQHIKEIEDYLSGNLNDELKNEFEQKLKVDSILQDELNTIKQLIAGIEGYAFKNMLKELHDKHGRQNPE